MEQPPDVIKILDDREDLNKQLHDLKLKNSELAQEADKVRGLEAEIERLVNDQNTLRAESQRQIAENASLDLKLREASAELRAFGDIEDELRQAKRERAEAIQEQDDAVAAKVVAESEIAKLKDQIEDLHEIQHALQVKADEHDLLVEHGVIKGV